MKPALRIGIAGLGTVGGGVVKMLRARQDHIAAMTGRQIEVVGVCARDRSRHRGFSIADLAWHDDAAALARSSEIDVFVELIGGSDGPAKVAVEAALANGKHVVTANKALLAHHGTELAVKAEASGVSLNYEAAVAGGIPIIKAMREGLAAGQVRTVRGILNGTCNYILSEMEATGRDFADILADAQRLGYAEADPSFDIGGTDAAHKLAILSCLAFGAEIDFDGVDVEGIELVTALDIKLAREFGYRIKLLGVARQTEAGVMQSVRPSLIPLSAPLAAVSGVFNAVEVVGEPVGPVVLEGQGAGEGPTAAAVVADLVDIARGQSVLPLVIPAASLSKSPKAPAKQHSGHYYLRFHAADRAGSMAAITGDLAAADVSIEKIIQHGEDGDGSGRLPVVILTHMTSEDTMNRALASLSAHEDVAGTPFMLRIETA